MTDFPDPDDNDAQAYDDRNAEKSTHDEPRGTPPIIERPENTHIGYSEPDPAIDDANPVAIFE
jgi:hypothetical protein